MYNPNVDLSCDKMGGVVGMRVGSCCPLKTKKIVKVEKRSEMKPV